MNATFWGIISYAATPSAVYASAPTFSGVQSSSSVQSRYVRPSHVQSLNLLSTPPCHALPCPCQRVKSPLSRSPFPTCSKDERQDQHHLPLAIEV